MTRLRATHILIAIAAAAILGLLILSGGDAERPAAATPPSSPESRAVAIVTDSGGQIGLSYAVAVRGSLAVFGRGGELVVVDVSDPSRPQMLGSVQLPGEIRDVVLAADRAFVAADSAGLQIIDLAEPGRPVAVGARRFQDRADGVFADENHIYVAARSLGLRILDASDPSEEVGHIITPDEAVDVVVRDGFAYVSAWYESMRVIDVSDPTAPEEVSFASYDSYDNGAAWSVYVEGDIGLNTIPEMGLRTVDLSDPRDVKLYKVYRGLFAPAGVAARGLTAFVADQAAGFRVLDLSEPARLVEIGSVRLPGTPLAVALEGSHAYVAAREAGLRIVDISRPNDPVEVGAVDANDEFVDVLYDGEALLAAGIVNGVYELRGTGLERIAAVRAERIEVDGSRMLVAGADSVLVYERSSPSEPVASLPVSARGVAIRGDLTVVAAGANGIRLFDGPRQIAALTPERAPTSTRSRERLLQTPLQNWDVALDGDTAFVAYDDGIRLIDLSSPSQAEVIEHIQTPQRVFRIKVTDSMLLAACDDGLRLYGMPAGEEIAFIKTPSFATAVDVSDGRAYVGDLSGMITVVELGGQPKTIGTYEAADRIRALAVRGDQIAIAAGSRGVRVVRLNAL